MGNLVTRALAYFQGFTRDQRIVMLGLDAAGKTTVLYHLKLAERVTTIPTIGFNVETVQYKGLDLTIFDVGGQDKLRPLWRHYLENNDALIFVVDSADASRLELARDELQKLLAEPEMERCVVLVYANKMDLPGAASVGALADALGLAHERRRRWHVQGAVATTGDGLYEGLDWLSSALKTSAK